MIWFCKAMAGKVHALGLSGGGKAHSLRSQVVRGITAPPLAEARPTWQGGSFAPRCIPRTRAFRPWTRPKALRPLDFRPGALHRPGPPPAVSPAASTRRAFVPSMDLQTVGDFALPPDPHRPAVRRLDPRQGFRAPGPRTRGGAAPPPAPHRPAVRRLAPRQGFRARGPRTGGRAAPVPLPPVAPKRSEGGNPGRIGCAAAARAAKTTTAPCTAWTARLGEAHTGARCL